MYICVCAIRALVACLLLELDGVDQSRVVRHGAAPCVQGVEEVSGVEASGLNLLEIALELAQSGDQVQVLLSQLGIGLLLGIGRIKIQDACEYRKEQKQVL